MALFNEILVGRYNRALQKLLSMKGSASVVQLASEIQPVFPLFWGVENRYLEAWLRFGTAPLQAAVAAQNSNIRLRNPGGSNVIAVIEKLTISPGANDLVLLQAGAATADFATINPAPATIDGRQQQVAGATLIISSTTNGANLAATMGGANILGTQSYDFISFEEQEIPILPGAAIQVNTNTVNESLRVGILWRERYLEDSERT